MSRGLAEALAARIQAMTPPDQLRFAAQLLESRRADLALPIIETLAEELHIALQAKASREKAGSR